jgi:WD40 repeat protein
VLWELGGSTQILEDKGDWIHSVAFSPDGKTMAVDSSDGVAIWNLAGSKPQVTKSLKLPHGLVKLAFSWDNRILAVGFDTGVQLCDVERNKQPSREPLRVSEGTVTSVALSRDGKLLAAGYTGTDQHLETLSGGVVIWDVTKGTRFAVEQVKSSVNSVAFSPDCQILAASSDDGVILLDLFRTRRQGETLKLSEDRGASVLFSPDGRTLAVGCSSNVVLYATGMDSWIQLAARSANRNLTKKEWRHYFPDIPYRPTFPDLPLLPPEDEKADTAALPLGANDTAKPNNE